jgi:hypothetical protein
MKKTVNRTQMETFAKTLEAAKERKTLPADAFNSLHAHFQAEDGNGAIWTVGIHTRKWHRLEKGKWTPAYPPETLYMDENLAAELEKLTAGRACRQCGRALPPGKNFCSACGARAEVEPLTRCCPQCSQEVPPGRNFCAACGTRTP